MERYLVLVRTMESYFKGFIVEYIECHKNNEADDLAKAAAHITLIPADVFCHVVEDASAKIVLPEPRVIHIIKAEDWRAPIMAYFHHYYEPDSRNEQIRMQQ
jgi:hypothetical protein